MARAGPEELKVNTSAAASKGLPPVNTGDQLADTEAFVPVKHWQQMPEDFSCCLFTTRSNLASLIQV